MKAIAIPLLLATLLILQTVPLNGRSVEAALLTDFFGVDNTPPDGRPEFANAQSPFLVVGRMPNGNLARSVLVFRLPEGIRADGIESATLEFHLLMNTLKGNVRAHLLHSPSYAETRPFAMAFALGSFKQTGKVAATGKSKPNTRVRLVVTPQVVLDLKQEGAGRGISAFRIDLSHELGPVGGRFLFASSRNTDGPAGPRLVLEVRTPPPS